MLLWIVVIILAALAVVVTLYARSSSTTGGVAYGLSMGMFAVGATVADIARFYGPALHRHEVAFGGMVVGTTGLVMLVREIHGSWRQVVCDTALQLNGLVLLAYLPVLVLADPPDSLAQNLDVCTTGLVVISGGLVLNLARVTALPSNADRLLLAGFASLRPLAWILVAAASSGVLDVPLDVSLAICLTDGVCISVVMARLARHRTPAASVPRRYTSGKRTYAFTSVVAAIILPALVVDPGLGRRSLIGLAGISIGAMIVRLITSPDEMEAAGRHLEERERYFRTLVQDTSDVIMISTPDGRLDYVSPAAERVLGSASLEGGTVWDALGIPASRIEEAIAETPDGVPVTLEGTRGDTVLEASITNRGDQLVISARDVTERDQLRRRLHRLAYHDTLTDLPNRLQLLESVGAMLDDARAGGPQVSVLFVDLDRFKQINDASGHAVGDEVLRQVADRLRHEAGDRLLARLGGDEFVIVHRGDPESAADLAERVTQVLNEPFTVADVSYQIGASTGIALAAPSATSQEMLRRADLAMYRAKRHREGWALYEQAMAEAAAARVDTENEVAEALRSRAMAMYLQPLIDTGTREVVCAEALLRWYRRDGSVSGPLPMLEFAEQTHQLYDLTSWMLHQAVTRLATTPGLVKVAVNLPPAVLVRTGLEVEILDLLLQHGVDPSRLELEITEEAMVAHGTRSLDAVASLRGHGVRLVIDDFGTGYSSLSYLTRFAVDGVKIDRSFIAEIDSSTAARSVVRGLVGVTREMGTGLVAEGVETQDQHNWLLELGVPFAQGYLYARPHDHADLADIRVLSSWPRPAVPPAA